MYDSDEVRDAVRRDAAEFYMRMTQAVLRGEATLPLSPLDNAALDDALAAEGNPWQKAIWDYVQSGEGLTELGRLEMIAAGVSAAMKAWAEEIAEAFRPLMELLNDSFQKLREAFAALGRGIVESIAAVPSEFGDLLDSIKPRAEPFIWQRRGRKPEVRPVHRIDAVAAGRHPSVTQRTQLRGGRR